MIGIFLGGDISGDIDFHPGASTVTTYFEGGSSLLNNAYGTTETTVVSPFAIATATIDASQAIPTTRYSLAATTTIYLVVSAGFTISSLTAYGSIRARRMR